MSGPRESMGEQKTMIMAQTAELSRLLGMVPSDGTIEIHDPVSHDTMSLSNWLNATRDSFLKLSVLMSKALDIQLQ